MFLSRHFLIGNNLILGQFLQENVEEFLGVKSSEKQENEKSQRYYIFLKLTQSLYSCKNDLLTSIQNLKNSEGGSGC